MKLRYIILLGLFLFFAFGCTFKKPVYYGCCTVDSTDPTNPQCTGLSRTDSSVVRFVGSNFCDSTNQTCNVTLQLLTGSDRSEFSAVLPYCTQASSSCINGDCTAQVCGIYKYDPSARLSYSDSQRFSSDPSSTRIFGDAPPSGLFGRSCLLIDASSDLDSFMKNSKGSFINSFRFGFGSDFAEFEKFRYQFPSSDAFCNINPDLSAKDRYQNFMLSPEDSIQGRFTLNEILGPTSTYLFCPKEENSPFFSTTFSSGDYPTYKYRSVTYAQFAVNYSGEYRSPSGGSSYAYENLTVNRTGTYQFSEFDKKFYQANLPLVYYGQIRDSYLGSSSIPAAAPFECSSALDCKSSLCNYQDYYRGVCRTTGGNWVDCGCDTQSLQCLGINSSMNFSLGTPNNPQVVQDYIDAYLENGTQFYTKEDLGVYVVQARIDPDCDSGVLDGIDPSDCSDNGETCLNYGGQVINASPNFPSGVRFFGETKDGYIGYSLMREDEFLQTNFAANCNLRAGVDYNIVEATGFEGPIREDGMNQNDVNAIMATGAIFHGPSSIPRAQGYFMSQPPRCVSVGDEGRADLGYYTYVPYYIMIRSAGSCQINSRSLPTSYGFGWCEGCSYSSIAKQTITTNLSRNYSTLAQSSPIYSNRNQSDYVCSLNESAIISNFGESAFNPTPIFSPQNLVSLPINSTLNQEVSDIFNNRFRSTRLTCPMINQVDNPTHSFEFNSFNSYPDAAYINLKQKQFLDQGILPVLDLSDNSNWYSNGSLALQNGITNDAPSILIISNFTITSPLDVILSRVNSAKEVCPKCMISLRVAHSGEHGASASIRWALDRVAVDRLNTSATSLFDKVDVISYQFFPDELLSERSSLCSAPAATRNEEVFAFMENMSKTYLYRYSSASEQKFKLSLIPEFNFRSSCLDSNETLSLYSYLFSKSERLSKSGLIGIIYSAPANEIHSSGSFTDQYCALSVGSKNLHLADPVSVFTQKFATENVSCVPCSEFDILSGKCSRSCSNGVLCGFSPDEERRYLRDSSLPLLPDGSPAVKCPPSTIADPCVPCSARTETASCNFYLNDGSTFSQNFPINQLNELTSDVIGALPPQYKCCLQDSRNQNYTFVSAVDSARSSAPILFSRSNDPRQDCGVPQLSSIGPDLCGSDTPFRNYRLECIVTR